MRVTFQEQHRLPERRCEGAHLLDQRVVTRQRRPSPHVRLEQQHYCDRVIVGGNGKRLFQPSAVCLCTAGLLLRSEEHTSELQSPCNLVCRLLLEKKKFHIAAPITSVANIMSETSSFVLHYICT